MIMCDEIIDTEEKTNYYNNSNKYYSIIDAVSIYCYLIKYQEKQKHLLPIYITNNELKEIMY